MSDIYAPPFTMTEEITNLIIEIGELVGAVVTYDSLRPNPKLCRESRIRSIHSSLAIEQNTLTLEQVTDVINGKTVLGPPQDIREVKNAYEAYERMSEKVSEQMRTKYWCFLNRIGNLLLKHWLQHLAFLTGRLREYCPN